MKTATILVSMWCISLILAAPAFVEVSQAQESPSPADNMKPFSVTDQTGFKENRFRGEVVRIDGSEVVLQTKDGEVRLHRDKTSKTAGQVKKGTMVEVETNDQGHVLTMEPFSRSDSNKTNVGKKK